MWKKLKIQKGVVCSKFKRINSGHATKNEKVH